METNVTINYIYKRKKGILGNVQMSHLFPVYFITSIGLDVSFYHEL